MRYSYLLFDLDGTLVYSHEGIYSCFRYALEKMGREVPPESQLRECVGPPLEDSFLYKFGMSEEDAWRAVAHYREEYKRAGMYRCSAIPGAKEALVALKAQGYKTALATSKAEVFAKQIVDRLGLGEYLDVKVGCGLHGERATKADVVSAAMAELGARAEDCLMIGDKSQDVLGARACGVDCAVLKVGYGSDEEFASCVPAYIFEDFEGLLGLLGEKKQ